jgi:hypothetical protein
MLKKAYELFSGLKPTAAAGVFLAAGLAFMLVGKYPPVDPAWVTVVICGYPIFYNAVRQIIFGGGI